MITFPPMPAMCQTRCHVACLSMPFSPQSIFFFSELSSVSGADLVERPNPFCTTCQSLGCVGTRLHSQESACLSPVKVTRVTRLTVICLGRTQLHTGWLGMCVCVCVCVSLRA